MDEATLELRRKIDEMLLASESSSSIPPSTKTTSMRQTEPSADGGHGLLGAFRMEDFAVRGPPIRDERAEIQNEVRGIIKSCLLVEDEAIRPRDSGKSLSNSELPPSYRRAVRRGRRGRS